MTQDHPNTQDAVAASPAAAAASPVVQPENAGAETTPAGVAPEDAASYIAAIRENYSQYRAAAAIPWGNAIAFAAGDAVNADHPALARWLEDGLVEAVPGAKSSRRRGR